MAHFVGLMVKVWIATIVVSLLTAGTILMLPEAYAFPTAILQVGVLALFARRFFAVRGSIPAGEGWARLRWITVGSASILVIAPNFAVLQQRILPDRNADPYPYEGLMEHPSGYAAVLILVVGIVPFLEELIFRGWLQRTISQRAGALLGLVASSAAFSLLHYTPVRFPYYFLLGLAFGGAFAITGSIWAGVAFHAAYNGSLFAMTALFPTTASFIAWASAPPGEQINAALLSLGVVLAAIAYRRLWVLCAPTRQAGAPGPGAAATAPVLVGDGAHR